VKKVRGIEDIILKVNREIKGTKTEAAAYTKAVFKALYELLKEGTPVRTPLGTFKIKKWNSRVIKNKITGGREVYVPERYGITFTPNERVKKEINEVLRKREGGEK
jgi:nucleoid DNA-binding protein